MSIVRGEVTETNFELEQSRQENGESIDRAARLLELAQKAASLYSAQIPAEKRKLLNMVYPNSTWAGGELAPNNRKPFDMIVVPNQTYQRKKVTSPEENDLSDIWPLPTLYSHVTF